MRKAAITTREKLIIYFARNVDDELMVKDIDIKFGVGDKRSNWVCTRMVSVGLLTRRKEKGRVIFSAGPALRTLIGEPT